MNSKLKGVISYLFGWIGGLIVLCAFNDNDQKATFHACQGITLSVSVVICNIAIIILSYIPVVSFTTYFLSPAVGIAQLVFMILGIVKATSDSPDYKLPLFGDLTEKFFEKKLAAVGVPSGVAIAPKFDPNTGQPIVTPAPQANFDPMTGQPIVTPAPQANFDPNTGQPIQNTAPQANFDPNTGQPIQNVAPHANFDPNTGQPITTPASEPVTNPVVTSEPSVPPTEAPVESSTPETTPETTPAVENPTNPVSQ